jgi:hypothetical protein
MSQVRQLVVHGQQQHLSSWMGAVLLTAPHDTCGVLAGVAARGSKSRAVLHIVVLTAM